MRRHKRAAFFKIFLPPLFIVLVVSLCFFRRFIYFSFVYASDIKIAGTEEGTLPFRVVMLMDCENTTKLTQFSPLFIIFLV